MRRSAGALTALTAVLLLISAVHGSEQSSKCATAATQLGACRSPPLAALAPAATEAACCKPFLELLLSDCFWYPPPWLVTLTQSSFLSHPEEPPSNAQRPSLPAMHPQHMPPNREQHTSRHNTQPTPSPAAEEHICQPHTAHSPCRCCAAVMRRQGWLLPL